LFLAFQSILDHQNRSSDEKVMIKIQTTAQQTRLHTGCTEIHTTRMLHTRKFEQSWQQLSNWLASYIRPFQMSIWTILDALAAILKRENEALKFGRSRIWRSIRRIEALEQEIERDLFFSLFFGAMCYFIALNFCYWLLNMRG
jgi:hypothetical protein